MRKTERAVVAAFVALFLIGVLFTMRVQATPIVRTSPETLLVNGLSCGVTNLRRADTAPNAWLLDVTIENRARGSRFMFRPSSIKAYGSSVKFIRERSLERDWFERHPKAIRSGIVEPSQKRVFTVHLVGAESLQKLRVRFSFGGKVGELVDRFLNGNRFIEITPAPARGVESQP